MPKDRPLLPFSTGASGTTRRLGAYADAIHGSPGRNRLLLLAFCLTVVVGATAIGQLRLNAWNEPFFDALKNRDFVLFGRQLVVFTGVAGVLIVLNIVQGWLDQWTKIALRQCITRDLLVQWFTPRRAVLLSGAVPVGTNPDQRIQEDARRLTELTVSLAVGMLQSTLLLLSFVGVLWLLSRGFVFEFEERRFQIPGFMVWVALIYAASGSWLSWRLGRPLIGLNATRYAQEAEFRFGLMRANESRDGIALSGGEEGERMRLEREFNSVIGIVRRIANVTTRLTGITAGYGWFTTVVPIIAAAPGYFGGHLTFGGLMMVVGAFNQVQQALRWYVDNAGNIADWLATLERVMDLRQALLALDRAVPSENRITVLENAPAFVIEGMTVEIPDRTISISEPRVEIRAGERLLVVGRPGTGKSTLFRALAGLWPWGTGRLSLPSKTKIIFLPQRLYLPDGSLRDVLAYPYEASVFEQEAFGRALARTNLTHLISSLDRLARWDKELTVDEQQHLAFARLLVHKPEWVVSDEALCHLNDDDRKMLFSLFDEELSKTAVLSISSNEAQYGFYSRILYLTAHPRLKVVPASLGRDAAISGCLE
ncbi:ABC transporter ATP-binding protein/permease [Rhizobium sp. CNPSo 3968]|uniref:ABC transporter ATP-binding protein/permease n=1 Tax=Rhizobium sp. CNPSo 3968 TaxID=3021408 RepID=UPI000DDE120C|nr:ABC transporter ATP-binding protein/permease [Rhizobium sp. CNPSo 3968]MDK4718857.1 ABC transporter ATP-binding protein/permease [Rhizobium sp. CNPSo 3968]